MAIDPTLIARLQFGMTASFHIIFPCLIIGLAFYLAVQEFLWLKTGRDLHRRQYRFWIKPFAVALVIGMLTGVILAYQLDTNFAGFYASTAAVLVPIRKTELAATLVLEGGTIGIMLMGWQRVGPRLHFAATLTMALGVLISAACIIARNSWMQTPDGFALVDGRVVVADWFAAFFSPSFPYRYAHMLVAAFLTSAFFMLGLSAALLLKRQHREFAAYSLRFALLAAVVLGPLQMLIGHLHGVNTHAHQPVKVAAMEGLWETQRGAPFVVFALPDQQAERNRMALEIPRLASLIVTHDWNGEVPGLKEVSRAERPYVALVFFSFRLMVGLGLLMLAASLLGLWLMRRGQLYRSRWFLRLCVAMTPSGFLATIAGWCVTEVGRQPWTVYGLIKTRAIITASHGPYLFDLPTLIVAFYTALGGGFLILLWWLIQRGPAWRPRLPDMA